MKRIFLAVIAVILVAGLSFAQEEKSAVRNFIDNLPDIRTGVAWDMTENDDLLSITTVDIVRWPKNGKLCLGAGVIAKVSNNDNIDPVISLSYHIGGLEHLGFSYPLAKLVDIEVGVFAGRDFDDKHYKAGLQATILKF